MLTFVTCIMLSGALSASAVATPVDTARRSDGAARPARSGERQGPELPAPAAPATNGRARETARSQKPRPRVFVGRMSPQPRGPWVEVGGEPLTASFTGEEGDVLELSNTSGDVVVSAAPGNAGRIVARRRAGGRTDAEALALLERMRLDVSQQARRVVVRTEPAGDASKYRVDYEVALPPGMGVDVRNRSGSVSLTNVAGDVRVEALSGSISGRGLSRLRSMRTMSGDIAIEASTLVGDANLETVSGSVTASSLKASALRLESISGRIHVKGADCERVTVRTVNGDIEFASPAVGGGRYDLKTHAGSIVVLTGARSAGFEFEAQTFKGRVQSDVSRSGPDERRLSGRVGDGSAFFDLTSFVGNIHIRQ